LTLAHGQPLVEDRPKALARWSLERFPPASVAKIVTLALRISARPPYAATDLPELAALVAPRDDDLPSPGPEGTDAVSEPSFGRHEPCLMGF
jgi:hypothetical protein